MALFETTSLVRAFNNPQRADHRGRHGLYPYWEINERAGRLRAIIFIGGNSEFAKGVGFSSGFWAGLCHFSLT